MHKPIVLRIVFRFQTRQNPVRYSFASSYQCCCSIHFRLCMPLMIWIGSAPIVDELGASHCFETGSTLNFPLNEFKLSYKALLSSSLSYFVGTRLSKALCSLLVPVHDSSSTQYILVLKYCQIAVFSLFLCRVVVDTYYSVTLLSTD